MSGKTRRRFDIRQASRPLGLVLLAGFALCLGFWAVFVRPEAAEYAALSERSGPEVEAVAQRQRDVEALEAYAAALEKDTADLVQLRSEVLSTREKRYVEVQREVARLCLQFNIDLDSVVYGDDLLVGEELDRSVMTVPLEGSYVNLRNFLQAVEASDKFLVVERVALDEGKEGGVMLQLAITLATYFDLPEALKHREERPPRRRPRGSA